MLNINRKIISDLLLAVIIIFPQAILAETADIPIFLNFPLLQKMMVMKMFKHPNQTAQYLLDRSGCTAIVFSEPNLAAEEELLRVTAKTRIKIGISNGTACTTVTNWAGSTTLLGKPVLLANQPWSLKFDAQSAQLLDQQGRLIQNQIIVQALQGQKHLLFDQFRLNLQPQVAHLKTILPSLLPRYSTTRFTKLVNSLRVGGIYVQNHGLKINLLLDYDPGDSVAAHSEPALTVSEMQQLEDNWQTWDAFLTFIIKQAANATRSSKLRSELLEILLDARQQLQSALQTNLKQATDPVRQLFISSWKKLEPVLQQIIADTPEQYVLPLFSFMTATEAIHTLDQLGPALGLEISSDGLRRLARLLNKDPAIDPLQYMNQLDPELRKLFGFKPLKPHPPDPEPSSFNFNLIRSAYAASNRERLNHWVPKTHELQQYLHEIRKLLLENAEVQSASLPSELIKVFRKIVFTTAWQESCWRQYIVKQNKIVPIISGTGDIGLFQVNERVWRGFYTPQRLRWDIAYNAQVGSEILHHYMMNYALKEKQRKPGGGPYNLARATYSAYNGGPARVGRYRRQNAPSAQKKIDRAFWAKYQQVNQGRELAVAQCLGGVTPTAQIPGGFAKNHQTVIRTSTKPGRENIVIKREKWLRTRNSGNYTLQLAAMGNERAAKSLINKQAKAGIYAYFRKTLNNSGLYIVLYGNFSNRSEAEQAARQFSPLQPWIRDFSSIQRLIQ